MFFSSVVLEMAVSRGLFTCSAVSIRFAHQVKDRKGLVGAIRMNLFLKSCSIFVLTCKRFDCVILFCDALTSGSANQLNI